MAYYTGYLISFLFTVRSRSNELHTVRRSGTPAEVYVPCHIPCHYLASLLSSFPELVTFTSKFTRTDARTSLQRRADFDTLVEVRSRRRSP